MPEKKKKHHTNIDQPFPLADTSTNGGGRDVKEWVQMNSLRDKDGNKKKKEKQRQKDNNSPELPLIVDFHINKSFTMSSSEKNYDNHHERYSSVDQRSSNISQDSMFEYDVDDSGPHREMAIDVPDNFVASVKYPPRYPPPWSTSKKTTTSQTNGRDKGGEKSHSQLLLNENNKSSKQQNNLQHHHQPTPQEQETLHRHQEALKKRREEERRQQAEEEFLRASIRESKKLRALESNKPMSSQTTGLVNTAYDDEDDKRDGSEGKPHSKTQSVAMTKEPYLKKNVGVDDLFSCLHHIRNGLTTTEDQKYFSFLRFLFQNEQFQQAVSLHNQLVELTSRSPPVKPVTEEAEDLLTEVQHYVAQSSQSQELLLLLNKPQFKGLFRAHDTVSLQAVQSTEDMDMLEESIDYPLVQYGEDTVKIIHLEKTNEHLGATVKNEGESVIIGRIVKGGVAEKSGLLHEGDEILEVNGIDIRGRNINDVSEMLANMSGTITFIIIPAHHPPAVNRQRSNKVMHLRALFAYEPEDDAYIPCRELGISFMKGDILHAMALDDPNWWQAFREGEEKDHSLAGLIPSKSFAEQLQALKMSIENKENKRKHRVCACGKKEHRNKKKKKYTNTSSENCEIMSYEEIARYYPEPNRKRPVVLIGPSNIGCAELQQRLLDADPDRFGRPVPYTSCPQRSNDLQDGAYNHISNEEFNMMIQQNKFVEFGYLKKYLYGTSFDAVKDIKAQGKICLLKIQPETLKVIRASDLMPYVIFVCPPNLEKLWRLQDQLKTPLENGVRKGKDILSIDDQLRGIIDHAREIEEVYGYLFDFVLVNSDLDQAYRELLAEINRIEIEPQWVPSAWINVK